MKILVVSDIESKFIWDHFDPERFRDVKMIISCGDLSARYLSFLVTMIPCPLFYVPGNHDKRYEKEPPGGVRQYRRSCGDLSRGAYYGTGRM